MKERPILFNDAMVRAILDGRKTQTRRVIAPRPQEHWTLSSVGVLTDSAHRLNAQQVAVFRDNEFGYPFRCPYGQPGDRLWVREGARVIAKRHREIGIVYRADGEARTVPYPSRLAPAPLGKRLANGTYREASRITLEVTGVRVERLCDISPEDAREEGISPAGIGSDHADVSAFRALWESINGPGSWDANPWVWVVEFKRVES
jgi:hypothetical protein